MARGHETAHDIVSDKERDAAEERGRRKRKPWNDSTPHSQGPSLN